jgi:hypothetical protein
LDSEITFAVKLFYFFGIPRLSGFVDSEMWSAVFPKRAIERRNHGLMGLTCGVVEDVFMRVEVAGRKLW